MCGLLRVEEQRTNEGPPFCLASSLVPPSSLYLCCFPGTKGQEQLPPNLSPSL